MTEEIIEKSFPVSLPAALKVSNIRGSITIRTIEGSQINVKAVKDLSSGDAEGTEIKIEQDASGLVRVEADHRNHFSFWSRNPCRVHYTIEAPRECSLVLDSVAADANVEGLMGAIRMRTVSGNILARNLTGSQDLRTVSGDITAESSQGPLDLETVSGNAVLKGGAFDSIHGKTVSGDMDGKFQPGAGPFEFRTVSGSVNLNLPPCGISASLKTQSGSLKSNGTGTTKEWRRGSYQSDYFGGGRRLSMNSVSGGLDLQFTAESGDPVQVEVPEQAPNFNVTEILNKIDSGEMSVDDALKLLEE